MKNAKHRSLSPDEIGFLLLLAAILFGGWLRFFPVYAAGFPIYDGGLFYNMIRALQNNGYAIPDFVAFNGVNIPFAYPPLAFYVTGALNSLLHIPLTTIIQWFPAVILTLTIIPFYQLAKVLLKSSVMAGIAALFHALLPGSVLHLINGGGITRSLGQLFLILTITNIYLVFTQPSRKHLWFSILFGALVCLSHPEAALHTVAGAAIVWLMKGRTRTGTVNAAKIAAGVAILTSVWWIPRLMTVGAAPYLSAVQTGSDDSTSIISALFFPPSMESFLTIIALMAIIGIIVEIIARDFLLPSLYIAPLLIEPRGSVAVASVFMAILASVAMCEVIFPAFLNLERRLHQVQLDTLQQSRGAKILLGYFMITLLVGMYSFDLNLQSKTLSAENRAAFNWVKQHTPAGSDFIIVGNDYDLTGEWFPTLAERISETTCQGTEWLGSGRIASCIQAREAINACLFHNTPLACIEETSRQHSLAYDYIYIVRKDDPEQASQTVGASLITELGTNTKYRQVYSADGVTIFERLQKSIETTLH